VQLIAHLLAEHIKADVSSRARRDRIHAALGRALGAGGIASLTAAGSTVTDGAAVTSTRCREEGVLVSFASHLSGHTALIEPEEIGPSGRRYAEPLTGTVGDGDNEHLTIAGVSPTDISGTNPDH